MSRVHGRVPQTGAGRLRLCSTRRSPIRRPLRGTCRRHSRGNSSKPAAARSAWESPARSAPSWHARRNRCSASRATAARCTPFRRLWTAARHNVDAKFVICNNRSYRLLQLNIAEYWKEQRIAPHEFPVSFDLSKPEIRFDDMARSMGVPAARIERIDQIEPAIRQALEHLGRSCLTS